MDYQPGIDPEMKPGRVVRGTTQILIRLIRDKVWAIFCQGVSITNILYGHFVYANPVAKKELSDSGISNVVTLHVSRANSLEIILLIVAIFFDHFQIKHR